MVKERNEISIYRLWKYVQRFNRRYIIFKKFNPSDEIYIFHNKKIVISISKKCKFLESGTAVNGSFEIIFLCVKPQDIETAINENINIFRDDQTVISVAAGVTVGTIKKLLRNNSSVIRAMPNFVQSIMKALQEFVWKMSRVLREKVL